METLKSIKKQQQTIAKLERHLVLEKIKQCKQDTRRKIELGGLVIKAKMDKYSKVIILGALVEAFETLEKDDSNKSLFQAKGEAAFMGYSKS